MAIVLHYDDTANFVECFEWDNSHPMCNVGDVLFKGPQDIEDDISPHETIKILRVLDPNASDWYFRNVMSQQGHQRRKAHDQASGFVWDHITAHAKPFSDYNLEPQEEITTMALPKTGKTKAKPAKEKAPAKEKKPANPFAAFEKAGFKPGQKISFGADKEGKKYDTGEGNPKRGASAERFKIYKDGMTVQEFKDAGGKLPDLKWDTDEKRKWIIVK